MRDRWVKELLPDTLLFSGIYNRLEASPASGTGPEDWERVALAEFKARDKKKAEFRYLEAWKYLKNEAKWKQVCMNDSAEPSSLESASSSSSVTSTPQAKTSIRPEGNKSAKRARSSEQAMTDLVKEKKKLTNLYRKKVTIASHDLQLRIISQMQDGPEKDKFLLDLLKKTDAKEDDDLKSVTNDEVDSIENEDE